MQVSQIIAEIDQEIRRLQEARNLLADNKGPSRRGRPAGTKAAKAPAAKHGKRQLSPEGRKRISEALKARWAARRKQASGKNNKAK